MFGLAAWSFTAGYVRNSGSSAEKSALIGQWVGVINLQPLSDAIEPPQEKYGNAVMKVTFKPVFFSYLTRLQADGEATDATGRVKTFHIEAFMQPFDKAEGNLSVRTTGKSDDSLTGTWDKAFFTKDQIILEYATGGEKYAFDGILRRADDAEYKRLVSSIEAGAKR